MWIEACLLVLAWVEPKELASVQARRNFWSFQRPVRPSVPATGHPIDAFVQAELQRKQQQPKPTLGRAALLRRLTLDLTGLPPTPEAVREFAADPAPDAYQRAVDRLMKSPGYGERWALRWLDLVRYADTNGFELDAERPHAWRYRDYVIRAFQENKPFDRFLSEQLAGDELWPESVEARIATGFLRAGPQHIVGGNQDEEMNRQELLTEMTAAVSGAFLGLTMNCARCHNHKFDPILQADYYRFQAIFAPALDRETDISTSGEKLARAWEWTEYEARRTPIEQAIREIERPYRERLREQKRAALDPVFAAALRKPAAERSAEEQRLAKEAQAQITPAWDEVLAQLSAADRERRKDLRQQLHRLELDEPPPLPHVYGVENTDVPAPTHILKVGDHKRKLAEVPPGFPLVLALTLNDANRGDLPSAPQGRRAALARWLTRPDHPLTARVFVNRLWQFRMGEPLVKTANDFGALGQRPENRALLDWLAVEFVESGWNIQHLDRLILTSEAYRRAGPRRRLEAEVVRDTVLAVSGQLNRKMFGPPIKTPIEPEVYDLIFTEYETDNLWPLPKDRSEIFRRSIYLLNKRTVRLPLLANLDQPDTMTLCPERPVSTHALQALSLMNSDFMRDAAAAFAQRIAAEAPHRKQSPVERAYELALSRAPSPQERRLADDFLAQGGNLTEFCLALLNRNDFLYAP